MWEDVLTAFSKHNDIDFAYPTIRRFMGAEEGKTLRQHTQKTDDKQNN